MKAQTQAQAPIVINIYGSFPSSNDVLGKHKSIYTNLKKKYTNKVFRAARNEWNGSKITVNCVCVFTWFVKNRKKDPSNVAFANKFVFDGLVNAGIIEDDSWKFTSGGIIHKFEIDDTYERVKIEIYPNQKLSKNGVSFEQPKPEPIQQKLF